MTCHNYLRNCAHSDCICANGPIEMPFRRGLVTWTCIANIYALAKRNIQFGSNLFCLCNQLQIIRMCHIWEPRSEIIHVRSKKRIRKQVDMILDDHEVSNPEIEIDSTCGVGYEKISYAQYFHYSYRQCDHFHRIAFIEMDSALHCNYELAAKFAGNEIAFMANSGGNREPRDGLVWDGDRI